MSNVRSEVTKKEWDKLRKQVYQAAGNKCEICGGKGRKHPVECHEIWEYDDENKVQKMVRMIALCPACHRVKHIGLAMVKGWYPGTLAHLAKVNGWTKQDAELYVEGMMEQWSQRSAHQWQLDVKALKEYGVNPPCTEI